MYKYPLDFNLFQQWKSIDKKVLGSVQANQQPHLLKGSFNVDVPGDTYLDVSAYGKGYLWVNGRNLGRYWNVGPQKRLFCPGVWLKKGQN